MNKKNPDEMLGLKKSKNMKDAGYNRTLHRSKFYSVNKKIRLYGSTLYRHKFYQLPLILTALLHVDLINVSYLTACAFIRS